jgi:hypothetical protein
VVGEALRDELFVGADAVDQAWSSEATEVFRLVRSEHRAGEQALELLVGRALGQPGVRLCASGWCAAA